MNSYDKYKEGLHDENSPINQKEEEENKIESAIEAIQSGEVRLAYNILLDVAKDVRELRDKSKVSNDTYYFKKLTEIYNKL